MSSKKKNRRDELLSLIPEDVKKVLDLGCGDGGLGSKLKGKCKEVVGVEREESLYVISKKKLDNAFLADIKDLQLPYQKGYFDCIIYADVLNCLIEPLASLKKHIFYLKDGGYILASMPNIRYYKTIIRLIFGGTWDYVDEGILWKEHLRFFTLINMKEMFQNAGFEIKLIKRNIVASRGFRVLNFLSFNLFSNFLTYQYYILAKKTTKKPDIKKRKIYKF